MSPGFTIMLVVPFINGRGRGAVLPHAPLPLAGGTDAGSLTKPRMARAPV